MGDVTLKIKKISRYFAGVLGAFVLVVSFNNCDQGFMIQDFPSGEFSSKSSDCEESLLNVYKNSYHPFLSQTCQNCHVAGPGLGNFASSNASLSYASFASVGAAKINSQAISENHKPPYTGSRNISSINDFSATWARAQDSYVACLSYSGGGGSSAFVVKTTRKAVPATLATTFVKLEWDLETDSTGLVPLVAGIEIRKAVLAGATEGYEFRNPTLRLKSDSAGSYYARALNIYINDTLQGNVTTYSNIEATVGSTANLNMAVGYANAWAVMTPTPNDMIALEFSTLKSTTGAPNPGGGGGGTDPTPAPTPTPPAQAVTFTQLIGTGGVFAVNCVGCHSAGNPRGGLNITSYAAARTAAANIKSRMNNAANPMPTSGLVSAAQRALVDAWIAQGSPQ